MNNVMEYKDDAGREELSDKASNDALKAFEELRKAAQANGTADMTLEEINAEIDAVRRERAKNSFLTD